MDDRTRIVVVGGGFAGLYFTRHIDKRRFKVTIVDRNNFHSFPPLFYQVASSGLEPDSICSPFRRELMKGRAKGAEYHLGNVEKIDTVAKKVVTQYETIDYDMLVICVGTTNNFFGNNQLVERVFTIKSIAQAMRTRDEILDRLEKAAICEDAEKRRSMLSFTVVGGGASGVEIAGALGELKRYVLRRNYPSISPDDVSITLVEGSDSVLSSMSVGSQTDATRYLKELMVDIITGHVVKDYSGDNVILDDGRRIATGMLIWTAGVTGVDLPVEGKSFPKGRGNRLIVDNYNQVSGFEHKIFAIGDISIMTTDKYPNGHPQLAQPAIQQARNLAANLNRGNNSWRPFEYRDKGTMATIGRNRAVADIGPTHLSGFIAWLAWMFIHLISIIGMRNKISILIDWMWNYFNYGTSLRILLLPARNPLKWRWGEK